MIRRKPFENSKSGQTDQQVITVTEFAWAVSRVLNFVHSTRKSVQVTNRGRVIAVVTPPAGTGATSVHDVMPRGIEG